MKTFFFILLVTSLFFNNVSASDIDSTIHSNSFSKDSIQKNYPKLHSPKRATILSTIIPGTGQIYNKKYWKTPVIYIGFTALIYEASVLHDKYSLYSDLYKEAKNNDDQMDNSDRYQAANLHDARDYYRKYRDLTFIGIGFWYVLNIIDANVDAHFFDYDISDDLSIHYQPTFNNEYNLGLSIALSF